MFKQFIQQNLELYKKCENAKVSHELARYCKENGILIDLAPPYTAALNSVAERASQYLFEKARGVIYDAKFPKACWGYAVQTPKYYKSRIPNQALGNMPFELKYSKPPDLNIIKVIGCDSYMSFRQSQNETSPKR